MRALGGLLVVVLAGACSSSSASGPVELPPVGAGPSGGPSSSGSPSSSVRPSASGSASVSAVPSSPGSPGAVEKPAEADEPSAAGAEAFARYWMAELNAAYASVDPSRVDAISDADCATCQAYIDSLRKAQAEGRRYNRGQARIRSSVAAPLTAAMETVVLVAHDIDDLHVLDPEGQLIRVVKGERNATLSFELKHDGKRWNALQVTPA